MYNIIYIIRIFEQFCLSLWLYLTHRQKFNILFPLKTLPTGVNSRFWQKCLILVKSVFQKKGWISFKFLSKQKLKAQN